MSEQLWWTAPMEDEDGHLIMVTGRDDVDKYRNNPRYSIRVTITQPYESKANGMPTDEAAALLESALDPLQQVLDKDPIGIITGIYTGAGERTIVIYTASVNIFNKKLNEALASLPLLPLEITAENDPGWEEYAEMSEARVDA